MGASDVTTMEAYRDAAATAAAAGNWSTAISQAMAAKAFLAGMPNGGEGDLQLSWRGAEWDQFIADARKEQAAAAVAANSDLGSGIQRTKVKYVAVTD